MYNSESRAMTDKEREYLNKKSKRLRTQFPNAMLCHIWAQESQSQGRNSSNTLYFIDNKIYSYGSHYLAAKIFTDKKGNKKALVNSYGYSNSTSGHLTSIRSALRGKIEFIECPDCSELKSEKNIQYFNAEIAEALGDFYNTRKRNKSLKYVLNKIEEANKFFAFVGLPLVNLKDSDLKAMKELENETEKRLKYTKEKNNNPESILKKEAAKIKAHETLLLKIDSILKDRVQDFRDYKANNASLNWKDIKLLKLPRHSYLNENINYDLIRISKDGKNVETSRGANVPLDHALRLLKMILQNEAKQGERIGHFTLDSILGEPEGDKTIKIGCHKILLSEAKNVLGHLITKE